MPIDNQPGVGQPIHAHYECLVASEREPRPEVLEKVVLHLPSDAAYVAGSEQAEFRKQLFDLIKSESAKSNPEWNNPQGAWVQPSSEFPVLEKYFRNGKIWLYPRRATRPPLKQWVTVALTAGPFAPGTPFKL